MTQFQENSPTDSKMEGQTDPIYRTLPATTRGPTNTTAVDWHLKVKGIEYNVDLTKIYCITVRLQKINSIHKLAL